MTNPEPPTADDVRAADERVQASALALRQALDRAGGTPQIHTIDVETVRGWVRLELDEDQAVQLVRDVGDALGFNPGFVPR